jgi:hypothetical protein
MAPVGVCVVDGVEDADAEAAVEGAEVEVALAGLVELVEDVLETKLELKRWARPTVVKPPGGAVAAALPLLLRK